MTRLQTKLGLLLSLVLATLWGGCATETGNETTTVTLMLGARAPITDDGDPVAEEPEPPGTIRAAVVTISGIYLQGGAAADDDASDGNGRLWLSQDAQTTNLLTLSNDFPELVSDATVRSGSYEQVRMVISGGYLEVVEEDGTTAIYASSDDYEGLPEGASVDGELRMPSLATSGLKINVPAGAFEIEGEQKIVLLDFDISESFGHVAGNSGAWVMHPVVEATDVMFTGTVEIEANLADGATFPAGVAWADLEVRLEDADNAYLSASLELRDDDGAYEAIFDFVNPLHNPHQVRFLSDLDLLIEVEPATPYSFEVGSGEVHVLVFTIVDVSLPETD